MKLNAKDLIKSELEKRGISQKEMAHVLGISAPYVHEIIHGKKNANHRLFEFAKKLEIDIVNTFGCEWPDDVKKACKDLAEILISGNGAVRNAVLANLEVFKHTVRQDEKIKKLEEGLTEMQKREQQGSLDALDNLAQSKKKKGM